MTFDEETAEFLDALKPSTRSIYSAGLEAFQTFYAQQGTIKDFLDRIEQDQQLPRRERKRLARTTLKGFVNWMKTRALMKRTALTLTLVMVFVFSFLFGGIRVQPVKSQFLGSVYINPDGSITGTDKIQRNGNIYTLTANISGGIQVQKSNVVLDGAGYAVEGNGEGKGIDLSNGRGQDPSRPEVSNVTVKNLKILNFYYGVDNVNTHSNTFIGNYIENCMNSFWMGGYNSLITYNTMNNASIAINYAGSNNITRNNFINCWVMVWLSSQQIVEENYWSDYTTRYPDAHEIGNTGVWDTPYAYWENTVDNHPLTKPIDISSNDNSEVPDGTGETEPFPTTLIVAVGVIVAVVGLGLLIYFKKRKREIES